MADRNMTPNNKCHNGRSRKQKRILLVDAEVIFRLSLVDGVLFVCCSVKVCGIRVQKMAVNIEYNKRRADFQLHAGKSAHTGFGHRAFQLWNVSKHSDAILLLLLPCWFHWGKIIWKGIDMKQKLPTECVVRPESPTHNTKLYIIYHFTTSKEKWVKNKFNLSIKTILHHQPGFR